MTPPAAQKTTLEEYGAAYPRPIINGEFLNVENHASFDGHAHQQDSQVA
jgi:hypothetical protein